MLFQVLTRRAWSVSYSFLESVVGCSLSNRIRTSETTRRTNDLRVWAATKEVNIGSIGRIW